MFPDLENIFNKRRLELSYTEPKTEAPRQPLVSENPRKISEIPAANLHTTDVR